MAIKHLLLTFVNSHNKYFRLCASSEDYLAYSVSFPSIVDYFPLDKFVSTYIRLVYVCTCAYIQYVLTINLRKYA